MTRSTIIGWVSLALVLLFVTLIVNNFLGDYNRPPTYLSPWGPLTPSSELSTNK